MEKEQLTKQSSGLPSRPLNCSTARYDQEPSEMEGDYLVDLAFQLYARSCQMDCTQTLHERAQELKAEVLRRVVENR